MKKIILSIILLISLLPHKSNSQNEDFIPNDLVFKSNSDKKYYSKGKLFSGKLGDSSNYYSFKNGIIEGKIHYFNTTNQLSVDYVIHNGKVNGLFRQGNWTYTVVDNKIVGYPKYEDATTIINFVELLPQLIKRTKKSKNTKECKISYRITGSSEPLFKFYTPSNEYFSLETTWQTIDREPHIGFDDNDYQYRWETEIDENGFILNEFKWDPKFIFPKYKVNRILVNNKLITTDSISYFRPDLAIKDYMKDSKQRAGGNLFDEIEHRNFWYYSDRFEYFWNKETNKYYLGKRTWVDASQKFTGQVNNEYFPTGELKLYYLSQGGRWLNCPFEEYELVNGNRRPKKTCIFDKRKNAFVLQEYFPDGYPMPAKIISQ